MKLAAVGLVAGVTAVWSPLVWSAPQQPRPTFRASVSRVSVAATVRTTRGRPVTNLSAADFELFDSGEPQPILTFRTEATPVHVAVLVDMSGSMDVAAKRQGAHDNVAQLLSWLAPGSDEAGLFVFDKELRELQALAPAPGNILAQLDSVARPFGATSLFDAIADTGRVLARASGPRRAVVALTDGADNASRLTPAEVSGLASSIDVPVYVVIVVSPLDRSGKTTMIDEQLARALNGPLGDLARWTGGDIYLGIGPAESSKAMQQIVTELRQQYLLAFEPGTRAGWHPIALRTKDKRLIVRARSGYMVREQPDGL